MFIFHFKFHLGNLEIPFDSSLQIKNFLSGLWKEPLYMNVPIKSCCAALSCSTVYYAVQGGSNF